MSNMVARVQRVQNGYAVMLTPEAAEALHLSEGSMVEVLPITASSEESPAQVEYANTEEALRAFEDTLPQHEAAYRELAK
jgi:antitoxin component of MazEF toxin-antitoxin module